MQFGEIIEPSSRAVWEYDSDEDTIYPTEPSWIKQTTPPSNINSLIIFEGKIAVDFAETCIITERPVATLNNPNVCLYHLPGDLVVCTCVGNMNEMGGKITAMLEPWICKAKRILAVQTLPRTSYLGTNTDEQHILRSLYTTTVSKSNKHGQVLEQPNLLTGITAGVLSFCEHFSFPGSVWCLYSSLPPYGTDSTTIQPISDLMKHLNIPLIKNFKCKPATFSNLYM